MFIEIMHEGKVLVLVVDLVHPECVVQLGKKETYINAQHEVHQEGNRRRSKVPTIVLGLFDASGG